MSHKFILQGDTYLKHHDNSTFSLENLPFLFLESNGLVGSVLKSDNLYVLLNCVTLILLHCHSAESGTAHFMTTLEAAITKPIGVCVPKSLWCTLGCFSISHNKHNLIQMFYLGCVNTSSTLVEYLFKLCKRYLQSHHSYSTHIAFIDIVKINFYYPINDNEKES